MLAMVGMVGMSSPKFQRVPKLNGSGVVVSPIWAAYLACSHETSE